MSVIELRGPGALLLDDDGRPTWRYRLEPFVEAFHASGLPASEVEDRCGYPRGRLGRVLGDRTYPSGPPGKRRWIRARTLSYANAVKIARALDMDFVDLEV